MALAYSLLVAGLGNKIEEFLVPVLAGQGYEVHTAIGRDELLAALRRPLDLMLLDLPSAEVLPQLAEVRAACQCVMMVVGPARNDKLLVAALEHGADDYVQRPFRTDELLARIRAQLRRRMRVIPPPATFGPLRIDPDARRATRAGLPLNLSPEEFTLLVTLASQPGFCYPAGYLLEQVWGRARTGEVALVARAVDHLRALIEDDPRAPRLIGGDPSTGYWLVGPAAEREISAQG